MFFQSCCSLLLAARSHDVCVASCDVWQARVYVTAELRVTHPAFRLMRLGDRVRLPIAVPRLRVASCLIRSRRQCSSSLLASARSQPRFCAPVRAPSQLQLIRFADCLFACAQLNEPDVLEVEVPAPGSAAAGSADGSFRTVNGISSFSLLSSPHLCLRVSYG
jgi:hypothetical protein